MAMRQELFIGMIGINLLYIQSTTHTDEFDTLNVYYSTMIS